MSLLRESSVTFKLLGDDSGSSSGSNFGIGALVVSKSIKRHFR